MSKVAEQLHNRISQVEKWQVRDDVHCEMGKPLGPIPPGLAQQTGTRLGGSMVAQSGLIIDRLCEHRGQLRAQLDHMESFSARMGFSPGGPPTVGVNAAPESRDIQGLCGDIESLQRRIAELFSNIASQF